MNSAPVVNENSSLARKRIVKRDLLGLAHTADRRGPVEPLPDPFGVFRVGDALEHHGVSGKEG